MRRFLKSLKRRSLGAKRRRVPRSSALRRSGRRGRLRRRVEHGVHVAKSRAEVIIAHLLRRSRSSSRRRGSGSGRRSRGRALTSSRGSGSSSRAECRASGRVGASERRWSSRRRGGADWLRRCCPEGRRSRGSRGTDTSGRRGSGSERRSSRRRRGGGAERLRRRSRSTKSKTSGRGGTAERCKSRRRSRSRRGGAKRLRRRSRSTKTKTSGHGGGSERCKSRRRSCSRRGGAKRLRRCSPKDRRSRGSNTSGRGGGSERRRSSRRRVEGSGSSAPRAGDRALGASRWRTSGGLCSEETSDRACHAAESARDRTFHEREPVRLLRVKVRRITQRRGCCRGGQGGARRVVHCAQRRDRGCSERARRLVGGHVVSGGFAGCRLARGSGGQRCARALRLRKRIVRGRAGAQQRRQR